MAPVKFGQHGVHVVDALSMGRCNGGGGAKHGGGGYQDGQGKGTKTGKRGHGKSGQHDSTSEAREVQKRDKFGQPLNHGPYQNGYHVGASKQAAQGLTVQADNVAELGALLGRLEANESKAGGGSNAAACGAGGSKAAAGGGAGGSSSAAGAGGSSSSSAAGRSAAGEERRHDVDGEP